MPDKSKACGTCGEVKPLADYYRNRAMPDGLFKHCKPCIRAKQTTYAYDAEKKRERNLRHMRNREVRGPIEKRYREANRDKVLDWKRAYRERNPTAWHDWFDANRDEAIERRRARYDPEKKRASRTPERTRIDRDRRRARMLAAFVEDVYFDDVMLRDEGRCGICGKPITEDTIELDHIVPLAAGGRHELKNVQLAHRACNRRKGTKVNYDLRDVA
jgi:5-methylcytosine-specific restriction endonuclease McrA